jgi:hypothetical protein
MCSRIEAPASPLGIRGDYRIEKNKKQSLGVFFFNNLGFFEFEKEICIKKRIKSGIFS